MERHHHSLVKAFYREHYPSGKPNKADPIWLLTHKDKIICVYRLRQFESGQLLTGMVTHPEFRQQGYGSYLLHETRQALANKTCFCFAEEHNAAFYLANNFLSESIEQLPAELRDRLKAYQQKRPTLSAYRYHST